MEASSNVVMTAMKKAEDSNEIVIRFYEYSGKAAHAVISCDRPVVSAVETDNTEWKTLGKLKVSGNKIMADMKPWEYKTVRIKLK